MGESEPDAENPGALTQLKDSLTRPNLKRWLRLPEARAAAITLVGLVAANAMLVAPVAAQSGGQQLGTAICNTGAGQLITMGLFALALLLIYGAVIDGYRGVKRGRSKNTNQRSQQGGDFENAGMKLIGGVVIAAAPSVLSTLGFSLLSCVNAVQIFG
jgi:hypothetical protein